MELADELSDFRGNDTEIFSTEHLNKQFPLDFVVFSNSQFHVPKLNFLMGDTIDSSNVW